MGIMKRLGVIGGLGPLATAFFYELVIRMTDAGTDQEHMEVLIFSRPSIPDRTAYILGKSQLNPFYSMLDTGRLLVAMGAENIIIPCITAHYFYDALSESINAPVIHAIKETVNYLKNEGITCAGIMATEGTIYANLFQKVLEERGICSVVPIQENQNRITDLIYKNIKANQPIDIDYFQQVTKQLRGDGAEVILLGCSELSMLKNEYTLGPGYLDSMEVLAMRSILLSGAKLKANYLSLITK